MLLVIFTICMYLRFSTRRVGLIVAVSVREREQGR